MSVTIYNHEKMYTYIKGFATGAGMKETLKALSYAREKHSGQLRKSGQPYIVHPLTMACDAISMGIKDDSVVATILLHDVCEDCGVSVAELPFSNAVKQGVELMTFGSWTAKPRRQLRIAITICCSRAGKPPSPNLLTAATMYPAWPELSPLPN